ncbi:MBG domain-containing protein, partial [Pontiella sp.]|uniref:MBG domain-containing protein n=1 Tax=Pontiella sp. TaxID=2837462 RepID=UPI0035687E77
PGLLPTVADSATTGYAYTFSPTDSVNYTGASGTVTLVVNRRTLSVTADDKTKVYGEANPEFTVAFSGWVEGEDLGVLETQPTATCPADAFSDAGTYAITPANGSAANYAFSYLSGTLTVAKADQAILFPAIGTQAVTNTLRLSVSADSGMAVSLAVLAGPAALSAGTNLGFTAAGTVGIAATQGGNGNWNAASATNSFDVVGVITNVAPDNGTVFGGTEVVIDGLWLGDGSSIASVTLCGVEAHIVSQGIHSVTVRTGEAPPVETNGAVVVESGFGTVVMANAFTYRPVPLAPTALSAVDITDAQFTARWVNNDETATHYFVDVSESTNFTAMTGVYSNYTFGASTAGLVTGLVDGVTYWYRVRAANQYGSSLDSNVIEVPVSANTPYVQYEITNGVVSAGTGSAVDLTELFHGNQMTYAVVSNSNPALVAATIVGTELALDYTPNMTGRADITVRVADANGFWVETTITVQVVAAPGVAVGAVSFNRQIGVFEQVVSVTNASASHRANSVTLTIADLTADATVCNATGTDSAGNPLIQWNGLLAPLGVQEFTVQYYTPYRGTTPSATITASLSLEDLQSAIEGRTFSLNGSPQEIDGAQAFLLEFDAVPGRTYFIQYSADLSTWKTVYPGLVAPVNRMQWIDSGPPATESAPGDAGSRFYQIIELAE